MTAPTTLPSDLQNNAAPAVAFGRVRFRHRSGRPCARQLLVRTGDGVSLAVCDTGPRMAEHTVVFLHGLCLNQASWDRQIGYVLGRYGRSVRVISYDHRGHGGAAAAPARSYPIQQPAHDLSPVRAVRAVSRPGAVFGQSLGGGTAVAR